MALEPVLNQRLYQQVAVQIKRQIQSGTFQTGERLPSEKALAQQLGVSRPTVREAMIALEISGLVEIRSGSGSYVRSRNSGTAEGVLADLADIDAGPGPIELLKARMLIEGEIAAVAATCATAEDLQQIEDTIRSMEHVMRHGEHSRFADRDFHLQVARVTGNDVLTALVGSLWEGMFSPLFDKLSQHTQLVDRQEAAVREHRLILSALATRDAYGARAAMRQHLQTVETILADGELSTATGGLRETV